MMRVHKHNNTTAGWMVWSQEFRDQLCTRGFGSEKKRPLCETISKAFRSNPWLRYLCQLEAIQLDRRFTVVFCLNTVDN